MSDNKIGAIPAFTDEDTQTIKEVKEIEPQNEETQDEETIETETQEIVPPQTQNTDLTEREKQGLLNERAQLLKEISELRGQRRELKKEELFTVEKKIEAIDDVNPEDVQVVEKILRAKGYITKEESNKMFYESVKQEEINKFLEKHPEYKPENDKDDFNWQTLNREVALYKLPENPRLIGDILERAHKTVRPVHTEAKQQQTVVKRQIEVASIGSGGKASSPSPKKSITTQHKDMLLRGGWTEEEISKMSA